MTKFLDDKDLEMYDMYVGSGATVDYVPGLVYLKPSFQALLSLLCKILSLEAICAILETGTGGLTPTLGPSSSFLHHALQVEEWMVKRSVYRLFVFSD